MAIRTGTAVAQMICVAQSCLPRRWYVLAHRSWSFIFCTVMDSTSRSLALSSSRAIRACADGSEPRSRSYSHSTTVGAGSTVGKGSMEVGSTDECSGVPMSLLLMGTLESPSDSSRRRRKGGCIASRSATSTRRRGQEEWGRNEDGTVLRRARDTHATQALLLSSKS